MSYFKVFLELPQPATAAQLQARLRELHPERPTPSMQNIRAALAYLCKSGKLRRVGHGKYQAIADNRADILTLIMENNELKAKVKLLTDAIALASKEAQS